ncbi:MFS transporter [Couchioplanes caeruleus]|nr:MFS transporter [Couchioplanes caeruleus]UQU63625.1 MFS transporter [Couchioplanes caeruleus]
MSDDRPAGRSADAGGGATEPDRLVTFRDVFAVREYRAMYISLIVNWVGDYLARAAIIVLVYQQSHSVMLSAASFAMSYLPWVVGGPVLAAVAERYPYRRVLIVCDLARALPVALIALPGMPVPAVLVLLFVAMLGAPPTQAARSALVPLILERRQVVTGLALNASTSQAAQVFGYLAGATLAAGFNARLGLALDSLSFLISAAVIAAGVRPRPAATSPAQRRHLLRETSEGFRLVFGTPLLRAIALMVFALTTFTILPEGLAAGWAALFRDDPAGRGFDQGLLMAAAPVGFVIGGLAAGRLVQHSRKGRLIRPFALLAPTALIATMWAPNAATAATLVMVSGVAQGVLMPTLNGIFVLALPHGYRARAFGVMQGGMQLTQGAAVMVSGALAQHSSIPRVVGLWSIGGLLLMTVLTVRWNSRPTIPEAEPPAPTEADAAPAPAQAATELPASPEDPPAGSPVRPPEARPGETAMRVTPARGRHSAAGRLDG